MIEIENILDVRKYVGGLKAIIFDLDDTLYSEKEYVRCGYKEIGKLFPSIPDTEEILWDLFEKRKPAVDIFLQQKGIYNEEMKRKCLNIYRKQKPYIHLYKGVFEMLLMFKSNGYMLGMITDGRPEGQSAKIDALGLAFSFDQIIITDELGGNVYRKPCDKAFRLMAEALNVDFSQMCYVGDNIRKDFVAPDKLGMRCIWFHNSDGIYI